VRRQAATVRPLEREHLLLDLRAVGAGVVDRAPVVVAFARLAEIGEPEAAVLVEHDIVRAVELPPVALVVHRLELAGLGIDHLDRAALVVGGLRAGEQPAISPFGPIAAPSAPPPSCSTTCWWPSGVTRDSVAGAISMSISEPSGMAIGSS